MLLTVFPHPPSHVMPSQASVSILANPTATKIDGSGLENRGISTNNKAAISGLLFYCCVRMRLLTVTLSAPSMLTAQTRPRDGLFPEPRGDDRMPGRGRGRARGPGRGGPRFPPAAESGPRHTSSSPEGTFCAAGILWGHTEAQGPAGNPRRGYQPQLRKNLRCRADASRLER